MDKIPVGRTIGQAYQFTFGRYATVLGIAWLPMLLIAALGYYVSFPFMREFTDAVQQVLRHPGDREAVGRMMSQNIWKLYAFEILVIFAFIWIRVGVAKEILGLRKGPRFVYLSFGADELRVMGAYILFFVLMYAVMIAAVLAAALTALIAVAIVTGGAIGQFDPNATGKTAVAALILLIAAVEFSWFYVWARASYLIVPATVAEGHIAMGRSWELTRGNVWRIVGITIVTGLPLYLLEIAFFLIVAAPIVVQLATLPSGPEPAAAEIFATTTQVFVRYLPYYVVVGLALGPIVLGLIGSPSAFAYRALVPAKPPDEEKTA
jgi:hypothetical protein